MRIVAVMIVALGFAVALAGCGSTGAPSDQLLTLRSGDTWVYAITSGSVTLPASLGGSTQNLQTQNNKSTWTWKVLATTAKDANNKTVNILDRAFDLFLLDGREIKANMRLYFTQSNLGIFVHGINDFVGTVANPANDRFVPSTATPAFQFLYLPNPLADGASLSYTDPLALNPAGNPPPSVNYALQVGVGHGSAAVPAGNFTVKPVTITENFDQNLVMGATATPAAFAAYAGLIAGPITATLPDGTTITANIQLISLSI